MSTDIYTYTPEEYVSTERINRGDGSVQIGETIIDGPRKGQAVVGRGKADPKKAKEAGWNPFKHSAIVTQYNEGIGADGTYTGEMGLQARATGVTEQDVENYANTVAYNRLSKQYNRELQAAGLRKVQWGDTERTISQLFDMQKEAKGLKKSEPTRIKKEVDQARLDAKATNREIAARNEAGKRLQAEIALQTKQNSDATALQNRELGIREREGQYNRDVAQIQAENAKAVALYEAQSRNYDRAENRRESAAIRASDAEARQMQMQFEYARLAQQDRQARQDKKDKALMVLLQGLGNLGAAFTI